MRIKARGAWRKRRTSKWIELLSNIHGILHQFMHRIDKVLDIEHSFLHAFYTHFFFFTFTRPPALRFLPIPYEPQIFRRTSGEDGRRIF